MHKIYQKRTPKQGSRSKNQNQKAEFGHKQFINKGPNEKEEKNVRIKTLIFT